jgi:hypothetical protein
MLYQHILLRSAIHDQKYFESYLRIGFEMDKDNEYYIINIRRFHMLFSETASSLMPVIQNIIMNSLVHRSIFPAKLKKMRISEESRE